MFLLFVTIHYTVVVRRAGLSQAQGTTIRGHKALFSYHNMYYCRNVIFFSKYISSKYLHCRAKTIKCPELGWITIMTTITVTRPSDKSDYLF